jgi:hypothetical protein
MHPEQIQPFVKGAKLFESSCSLDAQVLFADKEKGFFIKSAAKGALASETELKRCFTKRIVSGGSRVYFR